MTQIVSLFDLHQTQSDCQQASYVDVRKERLLMGKKTAIREDVAKHPGGRPTLYDQERHCRQAFEFALLGLTEERIAYLMGVTEQTLNNWKHAHPEFFEALWKGKEPADAEVAAAMYQRARGYSHPDVDIRVVAGELVETPIIKHYPPDPSAGKLWLHNRQPKLFRERIHTELSGIDGGPIEVADRTVTNYAELRDKIKAKRGEA